MKDVAEKEQTVIRASPVAWIVFAVIMGITGIILGIMLVSFEDGVGFAVAGIAAIILIGIGIPSLCGFAAWHPLAIVSREGIIIPNLWGKSLSFIAWENVRKIIIVDRGYGMVGVFAKNPKNIIWADEHSKDAAKKTVRGLIEVPDILIHPVLSRARVKYIMSVLEYYRGQYVPENEDIAENDDHAATKDALQRDAEDCVPY